MRIDEFISELREKNIIVTVREEQLAIHDPDDALNPQIIADLKAKKPEIIRFFQKISLQKAFQMIHPAPVQEYYPLTSAQRRMYFLQQLDKKSTAYNMPMVFEIGNNIDKQLLTNAFKSLVARHESLRTVFIDIDGVPMQKIMEASDFDVSFKKCDRSDLDRCIQNLIRPFDLNTEYPIRICIISTEDKKHFLFIDTHHIVSDLASNGVIIKDLMSFYQGLSAPDLLLQYKDYAVWQQEEAQRAALEKHKEFWLSEFEEEFYPLELPTSSERPLVKNNKGASYDFSLDAESLNGLKKISDENGATIFMTLLAIYYVLLSKLSNSDDIIVGAPVSGRSHPDLESIVGMFVNTLPIRSKVNGQLGFTDFLKIIKQKVLEGIDHQYYEYESLIEELKITRDTSRNPLFDVMFVFHKSTISASDPLAAALKPYNGEVTTSKFDITLSCIEKQEHLQCNFEYYTEIFDIQIIKSFANHFKQLVALILKDPSSRISQINLLDDKMHTVLLDSYNQTSANYDLDETVLEMFKKQVQSTPDAVALADKETSVSYKELELRSDFWASSLIASGVAANSIVGLVMTRSVEMITSILAVLKTGAAYVPINPDQPMARTDYMLSECDVSYVITNKPDFLSLESKKYACFSPEMLDEASTHTAQDLPEVTTSNLAYIIYTSGSTGKPKGVMIRHRSLTNFVNYGQEFFGISSSDRILQFSPYYFDVSVEQIWLSLTTGASLILVDNETLLDRERFIDYISSQAITHLNLTPSYLEKMDLPRLEHLKRIVVSGEACKPTLALKYCKDYDFYNEYGPTEATIISVSCKIESGDVKGGRLPIGKPIPNTKAYILDRNGELLPPGIAGELYLSGANLAEGYINQPELTQKSFLENPFEEGKIYRTGDIAKWNSNGMLIYLGRNDDQVKLRGYRIELGEIETQLEKIKGIDSSVVVVSGKEDRQQLVAYVKGKEHLESEQIISKLKESLPVYMIPSVFIWLESFPVTANGKINRRALPDPEVTSLENYVAPKNKEQELLVSIWSEVLKLEKDKIGINSDFFTLGGHSLLATLLINRIKSTFSVALPLRDLFVYRTIETLSSHLKTLENTLYEAIPKAEEAMHYPLSSAQRRMYFLYMLDKTSISYNMPAFVRLSGRIDVNLLEKALISLCYRHETLRTVFELADGVPVQRITSPEAIEIERLFITPEELDSNMNAFIRPFDLANELPIRVALAEVAGEQPMLMMDMHHIITDAVSQEILIREFWAFYKNYPLKDLTIQYKDFTVWQQSSEQQEAMVAHRDFWISKFSEPVSPMELPVDRERPLVKNNKGASFNFEIDKNIARELRDISEKANATPFMSLFAIFNILLSKLSNSEDIVVGTPVTGRSHPDLESIVGMFVNTLPLRTTIDSKLSFDDFLAGVKEQILDSLEHQAYEYESLVEDLNISRDSGRNPLFDTLFVFQKSIDSDYGAVDSDLEIHSGEGTTSKFDMTLFCKEEGDTIRCSFEYYTEIFDADTIAQFANYYKHLVRQVVENPFVQLSKLSLLSLQEQKELLSLFNNTEKSYQRNETIHGLFEAQVARTPEKAAINFNGICLTYQEVNEKANQMASFLRTEGAGPGKVIGVYQQRSIEMIVSIIAILKSGAAYLPIDPEYPLQRVERMIAASEMHLLLTDKVVAESINEIVECVDVRNTDFSEFAIMNLESINKSTDLLYVIYTSGSTGTPKGVMVNHRNLLNLMDFHINGTNIDTSSVLQFTTLTFDPSFVEIFSALLSGGVLHLIDEVTARDFSRLLAHIDTHQIRSLYMPSSVLNQMFNSKIYQKELPSTLRNIVTAGEQVVIGDLFKKYLSDHKVFIHNHYGPAETHVVTSGTTSPFEPIPSMPTIGKPIQNTQIYILDEGMHEQPVGVPGELYIGGDQLGDGYLLNPEMTRDRFIPNPFKEGDTLYRTGDLGRWDASGNIVFLGRIDQQLKLNGVRIEPGEIESHLNAMDGIAESAVMIQEVGNKKALVGYYVSDISISPEVFRSYLLDRLPMSMIPGYYVHMQELPLTPTGKLNRRALKVPEITSATDFIAASTMTEQRLLVIWSEILDVDRDVISMNDDFFLSGGHSLLAITLSNRIYKEFSVEVPLQELFSHRTIKELAAFIDASDVKEYVSFSSAPSQEYYPLSSAQRRMYFLYEFDKNATTYNLPVMLRLGKNLNIERFEEVFKELVARHESLRTVFEVVDDVPMQRIIAPDNFKISYEKGNATSLRMIAEAFVRPFDLANEYPFRVTLVEVPDEPYLLMIDMHHTVNDGVSQRLLIGEFWSLYHDGKLPPLSLQYKDYAYWQQGEGYKEMVSKHKQYWLDVFAEEQEALTLPLDYPRSFEDSNVGKTHSISIHKSITEELKSIANREGVTMYTLMLSVYYVLLNKLSNQLDIVVGTPTAGRHHADMEHMVGMFVNTIPLRAKLKADITFKEFLSVVQQNTIEAFDHQLFQYEELVDALELRRNTGRNPLFDVFFSYNQKVKEPEHTETSLEVDSFDLAYNIAKFDLELDITDHEDYLDAIFTFKNSLFREKTILRFAAYFIKVISDIIANQDIKLAEIDILDQEEKDKIINTFNLPEVSYDVTGTVIDLIEEQVRSKPDKEVTYFKSKSTTYNELNIRSNQLANYLREVLEVGPGDRIGLCFDRSPEMITGFLAVLKAGATFVSIGPDNPAERMNWIIKDTEAKVVLTNSIDKLKHISSETTILDVCAEKSAISKQPKDNLHIKIELDSAAYMIYTSGSTGKPKGVVITHESLLDYSLTFKNYFTINSSDRVVQQASPLFDTIIEEVFPALISGAALIIMPEGGLNIESLVDEIKNTNATVLSTVPAVIGAINGRVDELSSLRVIISGGDVLLPKHIDQLIAHFDIYNTYGPSESTVCISYHRISSLENTSMIGKPIVNRQVYILNDAHQLCPIGVSGELCVSGKGLAKEYLNAPELTKEKFLPNPVVKDSRIYKTGDAARWNEDGTIEFLGRIDQQIKIRGIRIELGEIEFQLTNIETIHQALVVAHGAGSSKQLVAYLCGDSKLNDNELRELLTERLPEYMIPTTIIWLDSFPLTTSGKIDRKALPAPDLTSVESYVAPETEAQLQLVEIWSEVLGLEAGVIGINADFFALGGHSLLAITLINRINSSFSVSLALRDLFVHRTVASLSTYIATLDRSDHVSIPVAATATHYPLSSAQQRMYFLYEYDKNSTTYNMPNFFRISGDLDVSRLEAAFRSLVARHESLRTVFEVVEGVPMQRILPATDFELSYHHTAEDELDSFIKAFVRPFDLSKEYPIRISFVAVNGEDPLLMMDAHHIINDGVSQDILMHEFWSLYQGQELEDLPIQYKDYAVWQQSETHRALMASHKSYWLDTFAEELDALELPYSYPRPLERSNSGGSYSVRISKSESDALRELALSEGVTMYTLSLGLYYVLLHKLSNQQDIVVGTPTSGRSHKDMEGLVGMFVNTLALRNEVATDVSFRTFINTLQERTLTAFEHQSYQYEALVDALELSRNTGRNPLFDVSFSFESASMENKEVTDIKITPHEVPYEIAKFDLSLAVHDAEEVSISFNYRTDLFDASRIAEFCRYLDRIIGSILEDTDRTISCIDILSDAERSRLLNDFNATKVEYDLSLTVLDLFTENVANTPDATAIVFNDQQVSYRELDARSDLWASHLLAHGVVSGSVVGLITTRSVEMIVGILGIMKAGGAYLPINPDQPLSRTTYQLKECQSDIVITNASEWFGELADDYKVLMPASLDASKDVSNFSLPELSPQGLAYVIYTSGSTGLPKGVRIEHEGLLNLNNYQRDYFGVSASDNIFQFSPYYFDASVEQIWLAFASGAALVLVDKETLLNPNDFVNYVSKHKISYIHSTPSFLENLSVEEVPSLRLVVSGGEECKPSLARRFAGKVRFINEYGPTEGTVVATLYEVTSFTDMSSSLPIGKPMANKQAYVLDGHMKLLPLGVPGELYIGGIGLSPGYVNRPELTADRFVANPFGEGRLYKTGDIVRWNADGTLSYLGRNDHQVKLRGYRIELGEIESQLEQLSGISQSLVTVYGEEGHKQLVAYMSGEAIPEPAVVKEALQESLPSYMIPSVYIGLEAFPVTANGKIDRKALPSPDLTSVESYVAPETEAQLQLVEIWSEVLGLEAGVIGINADFFALGGHSLLAITLINRINSSFSVSLALRDLFVHRTVASLSTYIATLDRSDHVSIPVAATATHYPLSSAQQRMYFLYEYDKNSTTYNMPNFFRISGDLDVSRLEAAFRSLVARHESLRTVFEVVEGVPMQRILPATDFELSYHHTAEDELDSFIKAFVRPFDLSKEYPIRISFVAVNGEDPLLMMDAHHIINDGVSQDILMHEFWSLYQEGQELEDLPIQYKDYAVWQQSETHRALMASHKSYWLDTFAEELDALELPYSYPRPLERSNSGGSYSVRISKSKSDALRALALSEGVTMYTLSLGLYYVLLHKLSNQQDIVVGTPTSGRSHKDMEGLVGMFVNTLALRNEVATDVSFRTFINTLQERTLTAFEHQSYQYEALVDALELSRNTGRNPLFDVSFSFVNATKVKTDTSVTGLEIVPYGVPYEIAKFDLTLKVLDMDELMLSFNYSTDLFDASRIVEFSGYLDRIIGSILEDTDRTISSIDILSDAERSQLLNDFNATTVEYDLSLTVLDLFTENVARTPDATAIVFNDQKVSYRELDARSNLWASHLLAHGVVSGSVVGLVMTRSVEMIVGILGIMKAGGAYLPINPDQPFSRSDYMLYECDARLIISNVDSITDLFQESFEVLTPNELDYSKRGRKPQLPGVTASDLAYVIYTSGSTGLPKGVRIEHEGLINLNNYQRDYFGVSASDNIFQFSPYYFDASVVQIWLALASGASLVLVSRETLMDTEVLMRYLTEKEVSYFHSTPSFLENLSVEEVPSLRLVVSGGEECKPSLARRFAGKVRFINEYGPTEGTVAATLYEVTSFTDMGSSLPIGKPMANKQAYVLDGHMKLLPLGVPGELYIGGIGLSPGYVNRPELTADRFVANPFGEGRLYKTGDIVRWNADGTLSYLGRNDHQVKLRGYRIELGEIESQLEQLSGVSQSLVTVYGEEGHKQLVAYMSGEAIPEPAVVKEALQESLPSYMIPSVYIGLEAFPVTANGKIDRKALPSPDLTSVESYVAPETETQLQLVEIWSEVLGLEAGVIGINADFFALGGHSLLAITLINRINSSFSVSLALRDLFVHRTVASLSTYIATLDRSDHVSIPVAATATHYPLSSAQQRMYFLYEYDKNSTTYNMPNFFRISGDLDVSRLEAAFRSLVARHESLRTVFEVVEGVPMQRILPATDFELSYHHTTEDELDSFIKAFVRPFDLSKEYPIRISFVAVNGEDPLLMMDAHHIINDGVSQDILMHEFWSLYQGQELEDLSIQYKDYAVWQQSETHRALMASHKSYWLDTFAEELDALELPYSYPRPLERSNSGGSYSVRISKSKSDALRALALSEGVTMYTLSLGLYYVLLHKLSNQQDIVVGTPTSGRSHKDMEGLVGMFVNTLALRNEVATDVSFRTFINTLQERTLTAFEHQSYQYEALVDALELSRNTGRNPLFDVFFSFANALNINEEVFNKDINITPFEGASYEIAKFDLSLAVHDSDELMLSFNYCTDLFDASRIAEFSAYLDRIISSILEDADRAISSIDILSDAERSRLLNDFNATKVEYDLSITVLDLFTENVARTPDATAIVFNDQKVSYRELDARSNLWASHLLAHGVVSGSVVGLVMTRSVEMIVGILGIMKAGGAYLPINPDQPFSRSDYMLYECDARLIISNVDSITDLFQESFEVLTPNELDYSKRGRKPQLPGVTASDLAYVIYTSGSTGLPKGVRIEHEGLINLNNYQRDYFGVSASDNIFQFSPYYFDASVVQIWLALASGASLVLVSRETLMDTEVLMRYLTEKEVSYFHSTPSFLENLSVEEVPSLRLVVSGGEECKPSLARRFAGKVRFINEYGPTEGTVAATLYEVTSFTDMGSSLPIGKPMANKQAYVLDGHMKLLPPGVPGELYIGGIGLSPGYVNRPELTADRFVANPFGEGRLYKTGDIVRWNADGTLSYLGRNDHQVKLRGYRIELGEIESQLEQLSGVSQSLVTVYGEEGHKQLVAYMSGEAVPEPAVVKEALQESLPSYMIPSVYIGLEAFPVTANGKIDRKALPAPDLTSVESYVAPETEAQLQLVEIWSEVLGLESEDISIDSDFFNLGGNSLLTMKVKNLIKQKFDLELQLSEIFLAPTIRNLDEKIKANKVEQKKQQMLISLNAVEAENKLFMIHDGSGEINGYLELARSIENHSCYGLRFSQFDDAERAPNIREIASRYIEEIKTIQPIGPYHLLGWSLGGEIATEITLQLENSGEKVENLMLIDTSFTFEKSLETKVLNIASEKDLFESNYSNSVDHLEEATSLRALWKAYAASDAFRNASISSIRSEVPAKIKQLIPEFDTLDKNELFDAVNNIRMLLNASHSYLMENSVMARTLYIWPNESTASKDEAMMKRFFVDLEVQYAQGDHFSVLQHPNLLQLSAMINSRLQSRLEITIARKDKLILT
ncbi:non-ribosomal peptide synthase/polyketide synthase [Flavobacteriaceae bacterium M23B6Z8]